jgi:hypothetical protein
MYKCDLALQFLGIALAGIAAGIAITLAIIK